MKHTALCLLYYQSINKTTRLSKAIRSSDIFKEHGDRHMQKPWLKSYPKGIPEEIDIHKFFFGG